MKLASALIFLLLAPALLHAQDAAATAAKLAKAQQGSAFIRLKLEYQATAGGDKGVFQMQMKERRTATSTDVLFRVIWPTSRKGESLLVHQEGGGAATGQLFVPPDRMSKISGNAMASSFFGTDLAVADIAESFYAWKNQAFVGTETVDGVECQILESKPGGGQSSIYGSVKSWLDLKRNVPLRVEKYSDGGKLVRRIESSRIIRQEGEFVPATLTVTRPDTESVTVLAGTRSRAAKDLSDADFTEAAMRELKAASAAE